MEQKSAPIARPGAAAKSQAKPQAEPEPTYGPAEHVSWLDDKTWLALRAEVARHP